MPFVHRVAANRRAGLRALRAAIAIPAVLIVGHTVGGTQLPLYAAFGSFALLLFADFPGDRKARTLSYALLGVAGVVLISLGTLVDRGWLAVVAMFVVGTTILFIGVLSTALAASSRAALLTFILPVMITGGPAMIPERLAGWLLAFIICVPAAVYLFPPDHHDRFKESMASSCAALAAILANRLTPGRQPDADHELTVATTRLADLQQHLREMVVRPVGLTAGSRALLRVVGELEWLTPLLVAPSMSDTSHRPEADRAMADAAITVLGASAAVLNSDRDVTLEEARRELEEAVDELTVLRYQAFDVVVARMMRADYDDGNADDPSSWPWLAPHEIAWTIEVIGSIVSWSATADRRPVLQRLLGRGLRGTGPQDRPFGGVSTLRSTTLSYLRPRSVWLRNSLRGGLGLALAVLVAERFNVEQGLWVVLAAMSVLRSSALTTSSSVVRAIAGTVAGFAIGALLILVVGSNQTALWLVYPFAVLVASLAPAVISFAAGQAAFTVVILVLLNLIEPVGWRIGLVRIQDVVIGGAISLLCGLMLWPRGAAAVVDGALSAAYRTAGDYFGAAVLAVTSSGPPPSSDLDDSLDAARQLDDAMRQLQVEVGVDSDRLTSLIAATEGATRLRLAADAVSTLGLSEPGQRGPLPSSRRVLAEHARRLVVRARQDPLAAPETHDAHRRGVGPDLVRAIRAERRPGDDLGDLPTRLLWTSMYVHALERRL